MFFDICVSITMPILLLLFFIYAARHLFWEPFLRRQWLIIITPFFIGLTVSSIMRQSPYLITGLLFSGLVYGWLAIFRFPPSFRIAQKQIKAGQFEEALSSLSQAIQQDATSSELYRMRSLLNLSQKYYLQQKNFRKMKRFRKALHEVKNNFETLSPALKESLQIELDELEIHLNS